MTARFDDKLVINRDRGADSAKRLLIAAGIGVTLAIAIVVFGKPVVSLLRQEVPATLGQERLRAQPGPATDELTELKHDSAPAQSAETGLETKSVKLQARHPDKAVRVVVAGDPSRERLAGIADPSRISSR
jgi:hypothetical protein